MSTLETFKDTKIGRIPKEWDLVSFSQLGDYYGGVSGKSKDDFGKGKKYIPFMNIMSNDVIDLDFMDFVDIKDDENQNQVMNGDLFFNTSSETPNEVGMCSVLKNCNEEIYLNSFCFGFRLNDKSGKQFIPEYIARFMRSNYGRKIMLPLAQGMTRYNLSKKYFLKLEIPIPTLSEQQKIIEILSTVDEQISLTEKIIEKSKELKKGLMQKLFSEGIGHTEFKDTKIGRIPKEWDLVSFSQLGDYYGGVSGKSKDDFGKGKKYIPFMNIMSNDVIDLDFMDFVDIKDDENQNQVMNGDLFFNTSSETPNEVGMCSVLKNCNEEIYLNSFCFGFRLNDKSGKQFIPEYIARFMRSNYGRKIMLPLAQGMTRYNLSKKYFLKLEIPIPTLSEQQKIIEILSTVDAKIEKEEIKKKKLEDLKKGLMQQLLTGKKRVKV